MIEYKIIDKEPNKIGLMVRGHANFAPIGKPDIVCAAVSSSCYTAVNGCISTLNEDKDIDIKCCNPGHFVFTVKKTPITTALIQATYSQIKNIEEQYPQCFKKHSKDK